MAMERKKGRFGYNMILFNLGVNLDPRMTAIDILEIIDQVDKQFRVVLIAEKLDESLILMREQLCWSFSDIIFFSKNSRTGNMRKSEMAPDMLDKLRRLNSADVLLYNHFLARHDAAVSEYGLPKMVQQVEYLNKFREEYSKNCDTTGTFQEERLKSNLDEEDDEGESTLYTPNPSVSDDCQLLMAPEIRLIRLVREKTAEIIKEQMKLEM